MTNNIKTINFLPEVFRTDTNRKFLNATMDQLVSEPSFKKINGYIGRKFSPTYKAGDDYIKEIDVNRQNYQLEPAAVVVDPETEKVEFYGNYVDMVNILKYYGGNTDDHSRMFTGEVYSFDGQFDFDKFVNFSQYYWLENGPDAVQVSATGIPMEFTWDVTVDTETGAYLFSDEGNSNKNPIITLARGGQYRFNVRGGTFNIQSKPSLDGTDPSFPNINVREVMGVSNNSASVGGVVSFNVPQLNGQGRFTDMPRVQSVDYATSIYYKDIQGAKQSNLIANFGGIDGVNIDLNNKRIIFTNTLADDLYWSSFIVDELLADELGNLLQLNDQDAGISSPITIPLSLRTNVWLIQIDENDFISLVPADPVNSNEQVYVNGGATNASRSFYIDYLGQYARVPLITAPLATLYYQNSLNGNGTGLFSIVEPANITIDPSTDIVGQLFYTSPNGVKFTNGMKVIFDSSAGPTYSGKEYYIEGVGTSIVLVPANTLTPDELGNSTEQDYITINRASVDNNAWSRNNRWTHIEVLKSVAEHNQTDLIIDQNTRAKRAIIEFDANLKLFNYGRIAKAPIDVLDKDITDVYLQLENSTATDPNTVSISATTLVLQVGNKQIEYTHGQRIIFSVDNSPIVRSKIYDFKIVNISEDPFVNEWLALVEESDDTAVLEFNSVLVKNEAYTCWFNGATWVKAQHKNSVNQPPMFEVFNENGVSFGDANTYVNTTFRGTKLFSFKIGTGAKDSILGFPLSYRSFNNVGDIQFDNNFDIDTFTHLVGVSTKSVAISSGYLHKTTSLTEYVNCNIWVPATEKVKQYQVITYVANGVNNLFEIDILPEESTNLPNVRVLVDKKYIDVNNFGVTQLGERYAILVNPTLLADGTTVDILIYSKTISNLSYYQVPKNMDINPLNQNFSSITLGQMRNHLFTLAGNSQRVVGTVPGEANVRDLDIKKQGGSILKHAAPLVYADLFLVDRTMNFVDSIKLAQREYGRFKNKILELSIAAEVDPSDVSGLLDDILTKINGVKNENFSWYYSDMIPWGFNKTTLPDYIVYDPRLRRYELNNIFDDTTLCNKAVLIYITKTVNGVRTKRLLTKDVDYEFNKTNPSFTILDSFDLNYGDILTVVEYADTDGNYLPETPTKLGLHPSFVPTKYLDNTYTTPRFVIQGHDGSITLAFNDYRDDLLLEFELRIYNNIKQKFANQQMFANIPGKFRTTDYSLTEFNEVLTSNFLAWAGANRLDFTNNNFFKSNNPWTWNYKLFKDTINGEFLPGAWRAVFKWLFDTDRPHTHPWEMLGFPKQPTWWEDRYGAAPYTGGNLMMWGELSLGYIHEGDRAGIDPAYIRPDLLRIIPVDDAGNLRSPDQFCVISFNSNDANSSYAVGDQGPVEAAWRRSSEYVFALQEAFALTKPAEYFSQLINVDRYNYDTMVKQYIVRDTNQHLTPTSIEVNGHTNTDGSISRTAGYINWICDHLKNIGIAAPQEKLKWNFKNLDVLISYKAAGFVDKSSMTVIAEQSSPSSTNASVIIPDENYRVQVYKSVPVDKLTYSAVIVEKSQNGYTVSGYSLTDPYFTIVPSIINNNGYSITAGKLTAVIYNDFELIRTRIPYGFEFKKQQDVIDFLVGYQRQLQSQGFIFIDQDSELGKQDFILSAKEFLTWDQQGWQPGNVIILSPVNQSIKIFGVDSVVDEITNTPAGSKIMDPNFQVIKRNNFSVVRVDNEFSVTTIQPQTIAFASFNLVQYEHVMIFDNKTVFGDIVYDPATGNRQYRLKLIGGKTDGWTGALNPAGFMYSDGSVIDWHQGVDYKRGDLVTFKSNYYVALEKINASDTFSNSVWKQIDKSSIKTGLLPNFATNAREFESFYDLHNQPINDNFKFYSNGLVGFRERSYLTDLALDIETQTKFYQGYTKQKGTKNAILALSYAQIADTNNEISIGEEWAVRVGEYGALDSNRFVELLLPESRITANPAPIQLILDSQLSSSSTLQYKIQELYKASEKTVPQIFEEYVSSADKLTLPTAGFVHLDDVDNTIYDITDFSKLTDLVNEISQGYKIWCAKNFNGNWDVYRVNETATHVTAISYSIDNIALISTNKLHNLSLSDTIAIKNFDSRFDGFYQVYNIVNGNTFAIALRENYKELQKASSVPGIGSLFKLSSMVVTYASDINNVIPLAGWDDNDRVWVKSAEALEAWGVYEKSTPWETDAVLLLESIEYRGNDNFGSSVNLSADGTVMYAGAPGSGTGRAAIFSKSFDGTWYENSNYVPDSNFTVRFGEQVEGSSKAMVVTAPASNNGDGYVFVYRTDLASGIVLTQLLFSPDSLPSSKFGQSISVSDDGNWLYIGAPGTNKIHTYTWDDRDLTIQTIVGDGVSTLFPLADLTISSANGIVVSGNNVYVPTVEFTKSGNNIVFSTAPILGESITITAQSGYKYVSSITGTGEFGAVLRTNNNGDYLVVGSPGETVSGVSNAGKAYVYVKNAEGFVATGINSSFTTQRTLSIESRVFLNNVLQTTSDYSRSGNTITFLFVVPAGVNVRIETNQFNLLQEITPDNVVKDQRFGSAIDLVDNHTIVISSPTYYDSDYSNGIVYTYFNKGVSFNTITSTIASPILIPGQSIFVNDIEVSLTGVSIESLATDINVKNILGVSAIAENGLITIFSVNEIDLIVTPGVGNVLGTIGMQVFKMTQPITHISNINGEKFGTQVKLNEVGDKLLVSSVGASITQLTTFDNSEMVLDSYSTYFNDKIGNTGAVYLYDLLSNPLKLESNPSQFVHTQQLIPTTVDNNFNFGASIDVRGSYIVIGASNDTTATVNGGAVHAFRDDTGANGWKLIRKSEPRVEPLTIDKLYLYNTKTNKILSRLDYIDPIKGKILGIAQQDIDFIADLDPARYNDSLATDNSTAPTLSDSFYWTNQQVGKIWWDISTMRYIDYEQGDIQYRSNHWAQLFSGSTINVYEWVESSVIPSKYASNGGDGTPKDIDDSAFVTYVQIDPATGVFKTLYYYWVSGKTTVNKEANKVNSVYGIARLIEDPKDQNITYAAVLARDAINVYNVEQYLTGNDIALHIAYSPVANFDIIHSEYELVQENSSTSNIPSRIVNKLQDSIAGLDRAGLVVPDPSLSVATRTGIEVRPRQSMFNDRLTALENFTKFVNSVLKKYQVIDQYDISSLNIGEEIPAFSLGKWDLRVNSYAEMTYLDVNSIVDEYKILIVSDERFQDANGVTLWTINKFDITTSEWTYNNIVKIQSFNTPLYWKKIDWIDPTYDLTTKPTYTVNRFYEIEKLSLVANDTIKVNDNGTGRFEFYSYNGSTLTLSGIQNGTIEISSSVYDLASNNMSFDNDNFDTVRFDQTPNKEIRYIFDAIYNNIFIKELKIEFNDLFFGLVNYIFSEQQTTDWIFKTSFISAHHKNRELAQYPSYKRDNIDFYKNYIEEVKPFRTQMREYVPVYPNLENGFIGSTDFDLPGYFDKISGTYRSPDGTYASDARLLNTKNYVNWNNHHTYSITNINVVRGGTGFTLVPNVIITSDSGGGAVAHAIIDIGTGAITNVNIINPGKGYTSTPTISINGNGIGAVLSAELRTEFFSPNVSLSYNAPRSITTELKFDRISFTSNIVEWSANTAYAVTINGTGSDVYISSGNLVSHNGVVYQPLIANVVNEVTFDAELYAEVDSGNVLMDNNNRIMGYYSPSVGMPVKRLSSLVDGISYPGTHVTGTDFSFTTSTVNVRSGVQFFNANSSIVSIDPLPGETRVNFIDLGYRPNQIIKIFSTLFNNNTFGIVTVMANSMILSGTTINNESFGPTDTQEIITNNNLTLVDDQGNALNSGFGGVKIGYTDYTNTSNLDSIITSSYIDSSLGTRPEDINIDGGEYVDTFEGHAPEELLPGRMFDNLNMSVYTELDGGATVVGYRIAHNMQTNSALDIDRDLPNASNIRKDFWPKYFRINDSLTTINRSTVLTQQLLLSDTEIRVQNAAILGGPDIAASRPGVIYINGEKIIFWTVDVINNVLGRIIRAVDGTGAPLTHDIGSDVVDASAQQAIPGGFDVHLTSWLIGLSTASYIATSNDDNMVDNFGNIFVNESDTVGPNPGLSGSTTEQALFLRG